MVVYSWVRVKNASYLLAFIGVECVQNTNNDPDIISVKLSFSRLTQLLPSDKA